MVPVFGKLFEQMVPEHNKITANATVVDIFKTSSTNFVTKLKLYITKQLYIYVDRSSTSTSGVCVRKNPAIGQ